MAVPPLLHPAMPPTSSVPLVMVLPLTVHPEMVVPMGLPMMPPISSLALTVAFSTVQFSMTPAEGAYATMPPT